MNPEAQRIAIAEACGIVTKDKWGPLYRTPNGIVRDCPNYLNNLNAMHEAEKVLKPKQWENYREELWIICADHDIKATAGQRAEAFLRTLGKWEEGTK